MKEPVLHCTVSADKATTSGLDPEAEADNKQI